MPTYHNTGMSDDLHSRARQWWAEARQQSLQDEAEVEAWKAEQRNDTLFFLPGATWSIWDWVDQTFDRQLFCRSSHADRDSVRRDKP